MGERHGYIPTNRDFDSLLAFRSSGLCDDSDVQNLYLEGMPMTIISAHLGIPFGDVQNVVGSTQFMLSYNSASEIECPSLPENSSPVITFMDTRMDRKVEVDIELIPFINDYIDKWEMNFKELIQETGINSTQLKAVLTFLEAEKKLKWSHRGQKEQFFEVDLSMFKRMNDELAYFTGLMVTDGWIVSQKSGHQISSLAGIRLLADEQNEAILQRYADKLGLGLWFDKGNNSIVLASRQKHFVQQIRDIGIAEKKSRNVQLPDCITDDVYPAFLLGVIDGDGSVYPLGKKQFPLVIKITCASKVLMAEMEKRNRGVFGIRKTPVHEEVRRGNCKNGAKKVPLYTMRYYYADAARIYQMMERANLLDLGLPRKIPMAPNMILTDEEALEIAKREQAANGTIPERLARILRIAHPHVYKQLGTAVPR
jgi:hypothetical protein